MPHHPDQEQLAALQAGDGDRRQRAQVAAHVAGCPTCAEVVAAVEQARTRLALLGEPELPTGLHERLTAAVGAEATRVVRPARRPAWYRRPAAWGAAAAAILDLCIDVEAGTDGTTIAISYNPVLFEDAAIARFAGLMDRR